MAWAPRNAQHSRDNAFGVPLLVKELNLEPALWLLASVIVIVIGQSAEFLIEQATSTFGHSVHGIDDEHDQFWRLTLPISLPLNFASDVMELWLALGLFHIALLRLSDRPVEVLDVFRAPTSFKNILGLAVAAAIPWWAADALLYPLMADDNLVIPILALQLTAWALIAPLFALTPVLLLYRQTSPRQAVLESIELVSKEPLKAYGIIWGTYLVTFAGVLFCLVGWIVTNPVIYLGLSAWVVDRVSIAGQP